MYDYLKKSPKFLTLNILKHSFIHNTQNQRKHITLTDSYNIAKMKLVATYIN